MIGGALMAGLGLVGAEMFKQQADAVKHTSLRTELDTFHGNLTKVLSDYRNCNANFYPDMGSGSLNSSSLPSDGLYQCCPSGAAPCSLAPTDCALSTYLFPANTKRILTLNEGINPARKTSGYKPVSMQLFDVAGNIQVDGLGTTVIKKAEIRIRYVNQQPGSGAKEIVKKIPVNLKFVSGTGGFTTCVDAEVNTKNTLQQELCKGLDANLVQYNKITDLCEPKTTTSTHTCTGGQVLIGLDASGNKICRSAAAAFDESQAIDPTDATNCGGNPNVKFTWDSATNTIKVECP